MYAAMVRTGSVTIASASCASGFAAPSATSTADAARFATEVVSWTYSIELS